MGMMAGIGGAIGGLTGLFGGGSKQPSPPPQFPGMGTAASGALGGIEGLQPFSNLGSSALGTGQGIFSNLMGNPYGGLFQSGAGVASGLGQTGALSGYGAGNALVGQGLGALSYAPGILNTGMDPQQQLYGFLQNQNLQQTNAINAASGMGSTPYGAGLSALSNQQFNMNWQNQQLGRQIAAAQGAGGLMGAASGTIGAGNAMMNAAPGQFLQASGMPYSVFQGLGTDQFSNLSNLLNIGGQGANLANLPVQDYLAYIQAGNQANSVANQLYGLQLQANQQQYNQNMGFGSALGGGLYNIGRGLAGGAGSPFLGSFFGGGGGGWGGFQSPLASMGASINPLTGFITA